MQTENHKESSGSLTMKNVKVKRKYIALAGLMATTLAIASEQLFEQRSFLDKNGVVNDISYSRSESGEVATMKINRYENGKLSSKEYASGNEVIINLGTSKHPIEAITSRVNMLRSFRELGNNQYLLSFRSSSLADFESVYGMLSNLLGEENVSRNSYMRPDYTDPGYNPSVYIPDKVSLDPFFGSQWHLNNPSGADVNAKLAWDVRTSASSVTVGILDTGIDSNHSDLVANLSGGHDYFYDTSDYDDDGDAEDNVSPKINQAGAEAGHGTIVAGIIGADGENSIGVAGVCWDINLYALKVSGWIPVVDEDDLDNDGLTTDIVYEYLISSDAVVDAINASNSMGIDVLNASFSSSVENSQVTSAINSAGIILVASAGNMGNTNKRYPAATNSPLVIAVTATTQSDQLRSASTRGTWVEIAAPGQQIAATMVNNQYGGGNGSSFAVPIVTGAIALAMAEYPTESNAQIRSRLLWAFDEVPALSGLVDQKRRLNLRKLFHPWTHDTRVGFDIDTGWFGWVNDKSHPWMYSYSFGWIWTPGTTDSDLWVWLYDDVEWLYTNQTLYPNFYRTATQEWYLYLEGSFDPTWFYSSLLNDWVAHDL